jgi:hypothetical protein
VIEVATGQQRSLGPARTVRWTDNDHILVYLPPRSNDQEFVEVSTGKRLPPGGVNPNPTPPPTQSAGYRLEAVGGGEAPSWTVTFRLTDLAGARSPVEFDGLHAVLTSDGTVILGTPAVPTPNPTVIQDTTSNLFAIDPVTRTATYLATVALTLPNWPLAANARYVAWTDDYCKYGRAGPLGHTRIYDRTTKTITELDQSLWVSSVTSDDRLGVGEFGADALLDLKTLSYAVVVPGGDQAWSPDFKYAAVGSSFGHGGYCGA